jgi:ketosteroid isomerase-like protein
MHPNAALVEKLYGCLDRKDHHGMADCYHPDATYDDIAFNLRGKKQIHAMWHLIAETDLRASFTVTGADDRSGGANLVDDYTWRDTGRRVHNVIRSEFRFRDGLIVAHRDSCDTLKWGTQALGPLKGVLSWLLPTVRRSLAKKKLAHFVKRHPEYS